MTISEAIEELRSRKLTMSMCIDIESCRNANNAIDMSISALEENTKLKAEIEQLKWKLSSVETQRDLKGYDAKRNADIMSSQLKIIEQLKSELEQSVKLPCKVGDVIYDNDFGSPTPSTIVGYSFGDVYQDSDLEMDMEQIYFYSKSNRFNIDMSFPIREIGRTIFLSKEDAEQHLEDKQLKARIDADNVKKDFKEFCDSRDVEESKLKFIEVE